jgi:uncharacterized protein YcbK (DUF882 family)
VIRLKELLGGNPEPKEKSVRDNLAKFLKVMNIVRKAYGKPMLVTSGLRSMEHHLAIYRRLGLKAPLKSAHLQGLAVDIHDRDHQLWNWCLDNLALLEKLGLYLEDKSKTPTWVHFQLLKPRSGNRVFLP